MFKYVFATGEMVYVTVHKHAENDQLQQKQQHPPNNNNNNNNNSNNNNKASTRI